MTTLELITKAGQGALSEEECKQLSRELSLHKTQVDGLRSEISTLQLTADTAKRELEGMKRRDRLSAIAKEHHFTELDYLEYLAEKESLDVNDSEQIANFMSQLTSSHSKFFDLEIVGGSGSGVDNVNFLSTEQNESCGERRSGSLGDITNLLDLAPEVL